MKKIRKINLFAIAFVLSGCLCASDLTSISSNASAIVIGTVLTRTESATQVSFDLTVERTLKGTPPPTLHVFHPWVRRGIVLGAAAPINYTAHGLWALVQTTATNWNVIPFGPSDGMITSLFMPTAAQLPASYQALTGLSFVDTLILQIAAGIQANGSGAEGILWAIRAQNTPAVQTVLQNLVQSPNVVFQVAGLQGMLERSTPNSISNLVSLWPRINNTEYQARVVSTLGSTFRDPTPATVQDLARLVSTTSSPDLKEAAIKSLASVHTKEALPFLADLLSSADPAERMAGVFGISSFANGCAAETPDNLPSLAFLQWGKSTYRTSDTEANFAFRRGPADQEASLVAFWTQWWNTHQELH